MKKRLLITSIVMMLVVAVALSTATYAWFSSNATVKATGMSITAKTSGNLLISSNGTSYGIDDISLAESTAQAFKLKPASSVNGVDFFYVSAAASSNTNYAAPTTATTSAVEYTVGTNADGNYVYSKMFYIKADGSDLSNLKATISGVKFNTSTAVSGNLAKALKVGIAVTAKNTAATTGIIYAPFSGELNYSGITKATTGSETINSTGVTAALADGVKGTSGTTVNLASLTNGAEYQVLVTVWFEGQDENCTSSNASAFDLAGVTIEISLSATAA